MNDVQPSNPCFSHNIMKTVVLHILSYHQYFVYVLSQSTKVILVLSYLNKYESRSTETRGPYVYMWKMYVRINKEETAICTMWTYNWYSSYSLVLLITKPHSDTVVLLVHTAKATSYTIKYELEWREFVIPDVSCDQQPWGLLCGNYNISLA